MQFLLMIAHDEAFVPTGSLVEEIHGWIAATSGQGIRVCGRPLRPPSEARTVRVRDGKLVVSDGPFAASREQMCAFELLDCASLEQAVQAAAGHPMAKVASIEVRPVWAQLASAKG
jgi:hypothetical protein